MDRRNFIKYLGMAGVGAILKPDLATAASQMPEIHLTGTVNVLFDSWSTQVLDHRAPPKNAYPRNFKRPPLMTQTGHRLATIFGALKSFGQTTGVDFNVSFTNRPITPKQLKDTDVYVSLTRYVNPPHLDSNNTGFSYLPSELNALQAFVSEGGRILLHTNHGPMPGSQPGQDDYTKNDSALASLFGITLLNDFVTLNDYMAMQVNPDSDSELNYIANKVHNIVSHDSCIIIPPKRFTSIAKLPDKATVFNITTGLTIPLSESTLSPHFSILVPYGKGQVIVTGNSGMLADYGSIGQSTGLIPMENNLMFFLNCISYLAGYRVIPNDGKGPVYCVQ